MEKTPDGHDKRTHDIRQISFFSNYLAPFLQNWGSDQMSFYKFCTS